MHLKNLIFAGLVCSLACTSSSSSEQLSSGDAAKALENRNWLDVWPTSDREPLHVYRFTPQMGGGVYQDRTLYAGAFELFNYEIDGEKLRIRWPHHQRERVASVFD